MIKLFFDWPAWATAVIFRYHAKPHRIAGTRLAEIRDDRGRRLGVWSHADRKGWLRL
jgi:hypothetical protein